MAIQCTGLLCNYFFSDLRRRAAAAAQTHTNTATTPPLVPPVTLPAVDSAPVSFATTNTPTPTPRAVTRPITKGIHCFFLVPFSIIFILLHNGNGHRARTVNVASISARKPGFACNTLLSHHWGMISPSNSSVSLLRQNNATESMALFASSATSRSSICGQATPRTATPSSMFSEGLDLLASWQFILAQAEDKLI